MWKTQSQRSNSLNKVFRWRSINYQGLPPILWHLELVSMEECVSPDVTSSVTNGCHLPSQRLGEAKQRSCKLVVSQHRAQQAISKVYPDLMFKPCPWLYI